MVFVLTPSATKTSRAGEAAIAASPLYVSARTMSTRTHSGTTTDRVESTRAATRSWLTAERPGIVHVGGSRGLFASVSQGRTWKKLLPREIDAIALDPSRANVLYVGTNRGIVKSVDGGQAWSAPRLNGRSISSMAITPAQPQTIYAGVQWETGIGERHGGYLCEHGRRRHLAAPVLSAAFGLIRAAIPRYAIRKSRTAAAG